MALKKFVKIDGWDNLDTFYGRTVQGLHIVIENFDRVFCRCGETHSSEGGLIHKCPACGNTEFIDYSDNYYSWEIPHKITYLGDESSCPRVYTIDKLELSGERSTDRTTIFFKLDKIRKYEFYKNIIKDLEATTSSGYRPYYRNFDSGVDVSLIEKWPYFNDNKDMSIEFFGNTDVTSLIKLMDIKDFFENALKDDLYVQYPSLSKSIFKKIITADKISLASKQNLKYYFDNFGIDEEFYSVYDYVERTSVNSFHNIFSGFWITGGSSKEVYILLQELKKNKNKGFEILKPYILNGILNLEEGIKLSYNISDMLSDNPKLEFLDYNSPYRDNSTSWRRCPPVKDFKVDFPDEILDLLPVYIKENICVKKDSNLCESFVKDVTTLREMKIPVTAENLKVKTMNYYINKSRLASTYKLPEEKMQVFIDWFEKNPLKAVKLIENRRKLTKKQLDDFLKYMVED